MYKFFWLNIAWAEGGIEVSIQDERKLGERKHERRRAQDDASNNIKVTNMLHARTSADPNSRRLFLATVRETRIAVHIAVHQP